MILWQDSVFRGRSREDRDAHRIKDELKFFLKDNPAVDFGKYSVWDVCDVAWELSANAAEWSRALSAPVVLESGDNGMALHVRDNGVGVEAALGRPPVEAFARGVTSATHKPQGRGRGLTYLCELTAGGGILLLETGDVSVMCMNGRIAASSKSACYIQGTAASFFFSPSVDDQ